MIFCRHKFRKTENTLWCVKCGKIERVECAHKWERTDIITQQIAGYKPQEYSILILVCKKCGEHKLFKTTDINR